MWRRITVPAWRAALTMTLTTGFCMGLGVRWIGKDEVRVQARGAHSSKTRRASRRSRLLQERLQSRRARSRRSARTTRSRAVATIRPMTDTPKPRAPRIVLVGTQHPGNIGSAARAMKTMGLAQMVLVAPLRFPHAEADALAAGADDVLEAAQLRPDLASAIADC